MRRFILLMNVVVAGGIAAAVVVVAAQVASAAPLTVNGWDLGERVYVQSAARTGWVYTAELDLTAEGQDGYSYCVDLPQNIGAGRSNGWDFADPSLSPSVVSAAWLVQHARPQFASLGVSQATAIAALQIAIWEVRGESNGQYNLLAGAFSIGRGGASASVMNVATGFLGALRTQDLTAFETSAVWARNASHQDQIVFNPIPEPSSIILFAAGVGLIAFASKRKRA